MQGGSLLLGACREIVVALGNLHTGRGHAFGIAAHAAHDAGQTVAHRGQPLHQLGDFVPSFDGNSCGQMALGNGLGAFQGLVDRARDLAHDGAPQPHRCQHPQQDTSHADKTQLLKACVGAFVGLFGDVLLHLDQLTQHVLQGIDCGIHMLCSKGAQALLVACFHQIFHGGGGLIGLFLQRCKTLNQGFLFGL